MEIPSGQMQLIRKSPAKMKEYETFIIMEAGELVDTTDYTYVKILMCFDVKFDGQHKARYVADGSMTENPTHNIMHSSVVGIGSVWLALFIAELNKLQICAGDILFAFLQLKCKEKIWTQAGIKFGPDLKGKTLVMNKSIYDLKTASASFHKHIAAVFHDLAGFTPSYVDNYLWIKDCGMYYKKYITMWVDNLLVMTKDPGAIITTKIKKTYHLKGVSSPDYYLRGDFKYVKYQGKSVISTDAARTYIAQVT